MIENTNYFWNLIKRAQTGQKRPFEELTGFYYKSVYSNALRLIGNVNSAEIITSDVFIKAWEHIKYLNEDSPFNLWLNGLTIRITSSYYQKEKKLLKKENANRAKASSDEDNKFLSLTVRQRLLLILHDLEGYSITDCLMMLDENKESELTSDLCSARKHFISPEVVDILKSYNPEEWRKLTQDFEFWYTELESNNQLNDNLKILKSYRDLLTNLLSKNEPSETALNGLKLRLSDESRQDATEQLKQQQLIREQLKAKAEKESNKATFEAGVIFANPETVKQKFTEEVAEIFSNPDDAKEAYSNRLKSARKQKKFVKNLSYFVGVMNVIVIYFIVSNISHNINWVQSSNSQLSQMQAGSSTAEISVGDLIQTGESESLDINIQSIGNIRVLSNSKVKLLDRRINNNRIELLSGEITLNTSTYFNRLSIKIGNAIIEDHGSSSTIKNSTESNQKTVSVKNGMVNVRTGELVFPLTKDYICDINRKITYHKNAAPSYVANLAEYISNPKSTNTLRSVLNASEKKDALTLWTLLQIEESGNNKMVLKRLSEVVNIPQNINLDKILNDNKRNKQLLLDEIEWQL